MAHPILTLPVVQAWDCHVSGSCCKEYLVTITDEERRRIEAQGWDVEKDLGGLPPFRFSGWPWARKTHLNHREDGSCVFLGEGGKCRIHERFGYETKPLPCRLFPFILLPVHDHWRVGLRYACPSAAASLGREIAEHLPNLRVFADQLTEREKVNPQPDGSLVPPPRMEGNFRLPWPDVLLIVDKLLELLRDRRVPLERRLRMTLFLVRELRQARLKELKPGQLRDVLTALGGLTDTAVPNMMTERPPNGVGRILFRLLAALYTRKDHGPNRGLAARGRFALLWAAWRFLRGTGPIPRLHLGLPETTFEAVEKPRGPLPNEAEQVLERYYLLKVGSLQFCGPGSFGMPFWEGFQAMLATFPVILWTARMFPDSVPREQAVMRALTVVDDHFGFNRLLGSYRQRVGFRILAWTGELARLIAWYSR
jgi:lysine-N-methylase